MRVVAKRAALAGMVAFLVTMLTGVSHWRGDAGMGGTDWMSYGWGDTWVIVEREWNASRVVDGQMVQGQGDHITSISLEPGAVQGLLICLAVGSGCATLVAGLGFLRGRKNSSPG